MDDPNFDPFQDGKINSDLKHKISKRANRWKQVIYDAESAWSYLIGTKAAYDYACLKYIFMEINKRRRGFEPKTLMDFGSGIGTVTW